ncbi:MAG: alpha-amylase family protein, partial [Trueperaceae bacterium]
MSEQVRSELSGRAAELLPAARRAADEELVGVPHRDGVLFDVRLERWFQNLIDGLEPVYGARDDFEAFVGELVRELARGHAERPEPLKVLDLERDLNPDWFQRPATIGYVAYVDRFAGTLHGVEERLPYLRELDVSYLHLMSVLWPREGENDGGYAVRDYREVDPRLGDRDDLRALCVRLREEGISLCVDLVLNHCSDQHPWALRALTGDERYQRYFYLYPDRTVPDAFEATLPEVFPDLAPGNFRWLPDLGRWVWTTFHDYQWDLNWSNPTVFREIVAIMLDLANLGVEVFRLDAVAFLWKRMGTDCQNQAEVHDLLQALRACSKIATPAVAHKAEAIVGPDDLIHYFGVGRRYGKVANIAYHNSLMVQTWSALASRDTRLMTHALREFPRTPSSIAWATYLRCHDDIGWAVADDDAEAVGLHGAAHRAFLSDYYAGTFEGSHARGEVFGHNARTGDRRISGALAALTGLQAAREASDPVGIDLAIDRILVAHAVMLAFGGIPLLYMGDEL